MLLSAGTQVARIIGWVNQANAFARPRDEVAFLAAAENFSAAKRSSASAKNATSSRGRAKAFA